MGWTLTCLVVPPIADRYGRKNIVLICMAISIGCYIWTLLTKNVNVTISMMFFEGMVTAGRITVAYVYMQELLTPKW